MANTIILFKDCTQAIKNFVEKIKIYIFLHFFLQEKNERNKKSGCVCDAQHLLVNMERHLLHLYKRELDEFAWPI